MPTLIFSPSVLGSVGQFYATNSGVAWSTIRGAAGNYTTNNTIPGIVADTTGRTNLYTVIERVIAAFDTSTIPTSAVITAVRLITGGNDKTNTLGAQALHVVSAAPASTSVLANSDYSTLGTTSFGNISYASFSTAGTASNTFTLDANGIANINTTGYSKFGLRVANDLTNTAPTWAANGGAYFDTRVGGTKYLSLEVDYTLTQTTKTQTGAVRIQKSAAQTQQGVIAIAGTFELAPWGFAVPGMTFWGDSPIAQQDISSSQNQDGKIRITASTSQTQTGTIRIQKSVSQTQPGVINIVQPASQTQTGVIRIQKSVSQTQTGTVNIQATTPRTQDGKVRIQVSTAQTQTGTVRITQSTENSQMGIVRIEAVTQKTQSGTIQIAAGATHDILGVIRIEKAVQQTQQGTIAIVNTVEETITGKISIQKSVNRTISGTVRIDNPLIDQGAYIPQFPNSGELAEGDANDTGSYIPQFESNGTFTETTTTGGAFVPTFPEQGNL